MSHLSHFVLKTKKNETQAPTERHHLEAPETPEIPLKIWVPDRGTQQSAIQVRHGLDFLKILR